MSDKNSAVAIFDSHDRAEDAIRELQKSGFDMKKLSIVGKDYHTEENVVGYYNTGDRMKYWGKLGAFWGGFWGLFFGSAFFWVPGMGPMLVAGPLVAWIVGGLEGAVMTGGLTALGAGLYSIGIPKNSILQYETQIKNGKLILIAHGTADEVARAKALLDQSEASSATIHGEQLATVERIIPRDAFDRWLQSACGRSHSQARRHAPGETRTGCVFRERVTEYYVKEITMKTDAELQKDVMDEIKWEPSVTAAEIGVSAVSGVVTLNGTVPIYAEKWAAERAAQRVQGVKAIADEIQITPIGRHARTDAEIAAVVASSLKSHVWVPTDIQATVQNGWVTLNGVVNWEFQQRAATDCVRFLAGVKGVMNDITLKPAAHPDAIKDAIERALVRNAEVDAGNVKVAASGSAVTLSGSVRSWGEKRRPGRRPGTRQESIPFKTTSTSRLRDGRTRSHVVEIISIGEVTPRRPSVAGWPAFFGNDRNSFALEHQRIGLLIRCTKDN